MSGMPTFVLATVLGRWARRPVAHAVGGPGHTQTAPPHRRGGRDQGQQAMSDDLKGIVIPGN